MSRKGSLLALRDRDAAPTPATAEPEGRAAAPSARSTGVGTGSSSSSSPVAPSRQGKKAMTGSFSPEMSFAMHMTARKNASRSSSLDGINGFGERMSSVDPYQRLVIGTFNSIFNQ